MGATQASARTPHARRGRLGRTVAWSTTPLALLILASILWQPSHAAFNATTANPASPATNSWSSGTVTVQDQRSGQLDWSLTGLRPGSFNQMCLRVYYTGSIPARVRVFVAPGDSTGDLWPYSYLIIQEGTLGGGALGSATTTCDGFVASATIFEGVTSSLVASHTSFATGVGTWDDATANTYRTFRIYTQIRAGQEAQGRTGQIRFTWEARST